MLRCLRIIFLGFHNSTLALFSFWLSGTTLPRVKFFRFLENLFEIKVSILIHFLFKFSHLVILFISIFIFYPSLNFKWTSFRRLARTYFNICMIFQRTFLWKCLLWVLQVSKKVIKEMFSLVCLFNLWLQFCQILLQLAIRAIFLIGVGFCLVSFEEGFSLIGTNIIHNISKVTL